MGPPFPDENASAIREASFVSNSKMIFFSDGKFDKYPEINNSIDSD